MTTALHIENVTFAYQASIPVLRDLSLTVEAGTFLAVVGPNGVGKSTLISLLSGQIVPQSGRICVDGVEIRSYGPRELARKIAVVRQEFVPAFRFSVVEAVMMARTPYYNRLGFESPVDRQLVAEALDLTDTTAFASRTLDHLSGGERQRVFIARALAQDTPILLLDEPTSFLDFKHQVGIYDLLKRIQRDKGRTVVAVTHDINLAAQYCDEALLLEPCRNRTQDETDGPPGGFGHYHKGQASEVFTAARLQRAFGVGIFSAAVGTERVFLPLGEMAKDAGRADRGSGPSDPYPRPANR